MYAYQGPHVRHSNILQKDIGHLLAITRTVEQIFGSKKLTIQLQSVLRNFVY